VALAGMGVVFNTAELRAREFDADALTQYFGRRIYAHTCLLYLCLLMCFSLLAVCAVYLLQTSVRNYVYLMLHA